MKFSTYLYENDQLKSAEDIDSAIRRFDNLEPAKQPSEARNILKAADRVGYTVKAEKILKYSNKKDVEQSKDIKPDDKEVINKNITTD